MTLTNRWIGSAALILLLIAAGTGGCGGGGSSSPSPTPTATPVAAIGITVTPNNQIVIAGTSMTFIATVTNAPDTRVTWSVQEGVSGGSIDQNGLYTAPLVPGTFHITATSVYDATHSATVAVIVQSASATL